MRSQIPAQIPDRVSDAKSCLKGIGKWQEGSSGFCVETRSILIVYSAK
ncbi:hypothetical protein VL20_6374 [Microcystis panniformis FACHB-1757]|uniref:Uncharacterized protein n=1 Tax=Microcystis panniformis FACHB-1757 TaxID=1638788 RepID=A0A0K1SAV1_9CHRO|nr:hypothetical protein VL20_6374 [Microcystis panniformis FACHB-1757]